MSKQHKRPVAREEPAPALGASSFDDVVSLIRERRKYVDWIAALEAKKDSTPAQVYRRVHADYEKRLAEVGEKLASHRGTLASEQEDLRKKLEELDAQIQHHEEARAETELRAHVGELTAVALTEALRVSESQLDKLGSQRKSIETNLARLAEFFAAADGKGNLPSTSSPRPAGQGNFDELSFLNSVVGEERKEAPVEPNPAEVSAGSTETPAAASAESPPPLRPVEVPVPTPAPVKEPVPTKPEPRPAPSPEPAPGPAPEPAPASRPPEPPSPPAPQPGPTLESPIEKVTEIETPRPVMRQSIAMQMASLTIDPEVNAAARSDLGIIKTGDELPPSLLDDLRPKANALAGNVASNNPMSLDSSTGSELKTLRCRECSAMNNPSEWYCERCGAELSAL
jgi:hypothetical protein